MGSVSNSRAGEEAPGQSLAVKVTIFCSGRFADFKTGLCRVSFVRATLFNLQTTTGEDQSGDVAFKRREIAIMGCIVNGPGEMADADLVRRRRPRPK